MNILLIYPPLWDINLAPMLSTPMLTNMLNSRGHKAEFLDINSMFMNFILNKDFFEYYKNKINSYEKLLENLNTAPPTIENIHLRTYLIGFISTFRNTKSFLHDLYQKKPYPNFDISSLFNKNGDEIQNHYHIYKNITTDLFIRNYNASIPADKRLLYEWEEDILATIKEKKPDLIGFSVYCIEQFRWSLDFSQKIKEKFDTKIFLGGNQITSVRNELDKTIFNNCIDFCIYGNGEIPLQMIADNEATESIPNLIYKDGNDNIVITPDYKKRFDFYGANYDTVNFNDYFVPDSVVPVEGSRGCYWGKCEFCDFMDCMTYKQKNVDDLLVEMEEYINKYNVRRFFFTDAAMHPEYIKELSRKILEKKLKIYFLSDFRLEKEFDEELMKLMYDAGLRVALWGLESGSDRILQMYNKGTTVENNSRVIKLSSQAGIYNWCWTMILFPKETAEDMIMTRDFLFEHYDYIDYISLHNFTLLANSPITKHFKPFGLTSDKFFRPEHEMHMFSKKMRQEIFDKFSTKMNNYPDDLTSILLKCTRERP